MCDEEATYDAEDIECECTKHGMESEWVWDKNKNCWVCAGCNAVQ